MVDTTSDDRNPVERPISRWKMDRFKINKGVRPDSRRAIPNILAVGAFLLLVTLNLLAYAGRLPTWALGWPYSDKVIHFLAYGCLTLGLFARLGKTRIRIGQGSFPLIIVLTTVIALSDEGLQSFSPARSLEFYDLLSNLAGISCAWLILPKTRRAANPQK